MRPRQKTARPSSARSEYYYRLLLRYVVIMWLPAGWLGFTACFIIFINAWYERAARQPVSLSDCDWPQTNRSYCVYDLIWWKMCCLFNYFSLLRIQWSLWAIIHGVPLALCGPFCCVAVRGFVGRCPGIVGGVARRRSLKLTNN